MDLPKYNIASKKGEEGVTIVKSIVENDLNWIFRKNNQEFDFGIDAYIDIISEFAQITGKSIALQIKTGQSFFSEMNDNGWVYRGDMKHLNYYLNHDMPVIIVIVNEITKKIFWCLCDAKKTEKAGENWKITIPFHQELNSESKKELQKYITPIIDYASQFEHFWEVNKMLKEQERMVFIVSRPEIEKNEYSGLLDTLKRLEVNSELLTTSKGKIDILIHGYNDDPRELYEIEEVRNWIKTVFEGIQGWAYFLAMDESAKFLRLMQLCNIDYTVVKEGHITKSSSEERKVKVDLRSGVPFLLALYDNLNLFCEKHSISVEINKEISLKLAEYLSGYKEDQCQT